MRLALLLPLLLTGCGAVSSSETFLIRPMLAWETVSETKSIELTRRRDAGSKEVKFKTPLSAKRQLSFAGLTATRQALIGEATARGLTERAVSRQENTAGWTEAYAHPGGTALLLREDPQGRHIAVRITGPANGVTTELRRTIREQFIPPEAPPPEDPTEAFRRQYNLPGRQKAR